MTSIAIYGAIVGLICFIGFGIWIEGVGARINNRVKPKAKLSFADVFYAIKRYLLPRAI